MLAKLSVIREARESLNDMRAQHAEKMRQQELEQEMLRRMQMEQKLELMRQQKQEYLEYQHQLQLQRQQELDAYQMQKLQQKQQFIQTYGRFNGNVSNILIIKFLTMCNYEILSSNMKRGLSSCLWY